MGPTRVSRIPTIAVVFTILQIGALISAKTAVLSGVEGQSFDFRCDYPQHLADNKKYFSLVDERESATPLIRTDKHGEWEHGGRFAVYDNTSAAFFIVRVDELKPEDRGTYWCGVNVNNMPDHISAIHLNVSRVMEVVTISMDTHKDKHILPLYLTTVMCVSALLFVCLFTCCLLLVVKTRRSSSHPNRETLSDYETMVPGVSTELQCNCRCATECCKDFSAPPPNPPPRLTFKQRDSTLSYGPGDYVEVDAPECLCPYQHLDLSHLENHVYHSLGNNGPKHGPAKETFTCQ